MWDLCKETVTFFLFPNVIFLSFQFQKASRAHFHFLARLSRVHSIQIVCVHEIGATYISRIWQWYTHTDTQSNCNFVYQQRERERWHRHAQENPWTCLPVFDSEKKLPNFKWSWLWASIEFMPNSVRLILVDFTIVEYRSSWFICRTRKRDWFSERERAR